MIQSLIVSKRFGERNTYATAVIRRDTDSLRWLIKHFANEIDFEKKDDMGYAVLEYLNGKTNNLVAINE